MPKKEKKVDTDKKTDILFDIIKEMQKNINVLNDKVKRILNRMGL